VLTENYDPMTANVRGKAWDMERAALALEGLRRCTDCRAVRSLDEFSRKAAGADGKRPECQSCRFRKRRGAEYRRPGVATLDFRLALASALRNGEVASALAVVEGWAEKTADGCWLWPGRVSRRSGYGQAVITGRGWLAHRLTFALANPETELEGDWTVHHVCAVRACVNPEHLQRVTLRENVAEMRARNAYEARIAELEAALAEAAPDHPLLAA
jgi:hypothetical protein